MNVVLVDLFPRAQSAPDALARLSFWAYEAEEEICGHNKATCDCPRETWVTSWSPTLWVSLVTELCSLVMSIISG